MITLDTSQVLNAYKAATNGSVLLQLGDVVNNDPDSQDAQLVTPPGFCAIPSMPDAGNTAAEVVRIKGMGKRDYVIGVRDIRSQIIYGNLNYGEFCVFAPGVDGKGQARVLGKQDGSVSLYTTKGNVPDGDGMGVFVNAAGDTIQLSTSTGNALSADPNGINLMSNGAASGLNILANGNANLIATKTLQLDGSSINLGAGTAGVPLAPTNAVVINPVQVLALFTDVLTALSGVASAQCAAPGSPLVAPALVAAIAKLTADLALSSPGTPATGIGAQKTFAT